MAVQEEIRRNQQMQTKTFEWKMKLFEDEYNLYRKRQISPFFHFCGYYCHLYCEPLKERHGNSIKGLHMVIGLKGYAAPFKNLISCYYSLSSEDDCGREHFSIRDTIQISKETIHAHIFDGLSAADINTYNTTYMYFVFSWSENPKVNASEQENCTSVVERSTQTENTQSPSIRNIVTETEKGHDKFLQSLSKDLACFYESKVDTDCVLKIGEVRLPVHRSVLSARSSVFAAMFHHDTSESQSREFDILDVDVNALNDVIFFVYTGTIRGLSPDTAASMYAVADKYALINLRNECLDFLKYNLTVENVVDAALLAHTHAETELEEQVVQLIEERFEELMQSDSWVNFSTYNPLLANKLLCSALMSRKAGKI